jgi:hypothetical protein
MTGETLPGGIITLPRVTFKGRGEAERRAEFKRVVAGEILQIAPRFNAAHVGSAGPARRIK